VRASSAAARKAARSGGDNGPARREISASGSRSLIVDIDGPAWNKLTVFTQCHRLGPLPGGPFLCKADLDSHATDGYAGRVCSCTARDGGTLRKFYAPRDQIRPKRLEFPAVGLSDGPTGLSARRDEDIAGKPINEKKKKKGLRWLIHRPLTWLTGSFVPISHRRGR